MSSPYLKIGIFCALFATVIGLAVYTLTPAETANDYQHNGLSQFDVPPPPPPPAPENQVYRDVEKMPLFPGCEDISDYVEKKSCADRKLLEYVYGNINYPKEAKEKGVEGMAVVSFKVSAEGKVYDEKVVRDPGAGTGEEALQMIKRMIADDIRWEPGKNEGKPVAVQFNLPVRFKLK